MCTHHNTSGVKNMSDYDLTYISPTALSGYRSCPFNWGSMRTGLDTLPQEAKHLDLGSLVHELIAKYYRSTDLSSPWKERERRIDEMFTDNPYLNSIEGLKTKTADVIKGFKKFEKTVRQSMLPDFEASLVEKTLINGRYKCIVDVYSAKGKFGLDWKTSSLPTLTQPSHPQEDTEAYTIQASINSFLLNEKGYPCDKFYFIGLVGCQVEKCEIMGKGWIDRMSDDMLKEIADGKFRRKKNKYCYSCPSRLRCDLLSKSFWSEII